MKDDACELVTALTAVELVQNAAAVGFIIDIGEQAGIEWAKSFTWPAAWRGMGE